MLRSCCFGIGSSSRSDGIGRDVDGSNVSSSSVENLWSSLSNRTSGDSIEAVQDASSETWLMKLSSVCGARAVAGVEEKAAWPGMNELSVDVMLGSYWRVSEAVV